jgi:peroxiredoxin
VEAGNITIPFLSDLDTATMTALGILNEAYEPGDTAYGIPHPGVFVVNPAGIIAGKIFVENFRERVDGANTLNYAREVLEQR